MQMKSGEPQGRTDGMSAGLVFSQGVVLGSAGRAIYPRRPGTGGGGCSHAEGGQRHCNIAQEAFEERGTPRHQETQPLSLPSEQLLLSHGKCWDQGRLPALNLLLVDLLQLWVPHKPMLQLAWEFGTYFLGACVEIGYAHFCKMPLLFSKPPSFTCLGCRAEPQHPEPIGHLPSGGSNKWLLQQDFGGFNLSLLSTKRCDGVPGFQLKFGLFCCFSSVGCWTPIISFEISLCVGMSLFLSPVQEEVKKSGLESWALAPVLAHAAVRSDPRKQGPCGVAVPELDRKVAGFYKKSKAHP